MARNRPQRAAHAEPSRDFLSFRKAESLFGAMPIRRTDAPGRRDYREDRRGLPVKPASDRTHRLASLPAIPDLGPLGRRVINATSLFHVHTPSLECCADQLSPPRTKRSFHNRSLREPEGTSPAPPAD